MILGFLILYLVYRLSDMLNFGGVKSYILHWDEYFCLNIFLFFCTNN